MRTEVLLPDLYRSFTGRRKKQMAWAYLKLYYPAYIPFPKQTKLESDNVLICEIDFDQERRITAAVNERRAARQAKKKGAKKK